VKRRASPDNAVRLLVVAAVVLCAIGLKYGTSNLVGARNGIDFDVYRAAGRAVVHGKSLFGPWLATQLTVPLPFTYPPFAALIAVPFGLLRADIGLMCWDVLSVALLAWVVHTTTRPLLNGRSRLGLLLAVGVALALVPVQDALGFGQVGIVLMAMSVYDCTVERPRLPRGAMIGVATAIKLLPAMFIPYLWFSGRRRAAVVATATAAGMTLATFVVLPHDSSTYWTSRVFDGNRIGNNAYFSNQSLNGMLRRAFGSGVPVLWIVLVAVVVAFGLRAAVFASRRHQELLGVSLVALVTVLASPVSWIHHLVWIVPVLGVLAGDGTDRRRVVWTVGAALLFTLRLPYWGDSLAHGAHPSWFAQLLQDAYGLGCVALLVALPKLVNVARRATRHAPAQ
jgi:alpha-1,2-mannosyltransferase